MQRAEGRVLGSGSDFGERKWTGDFTFVQMADTQLGLPPFPPPLTQNNGCQPPPLHTTIVNLEKTCGACLSGLDLVLAHRTDRTDGYSRLYTLLIT